MFRNLTDAIGYLHSQGIAHRGAPRIIVIRFVSPRAAELSLLDLKPENILMAKKDDDTDIKVTDFGLSKVLLFRVSVWLLCRSSLGLSVHLSRWWVRKA